MKMTIADFDGAIMAYVSQKIAPSITDTATLFAIGFAKNAMLNKAHKYLHDGGYVDESGNVDIDLFSQSVRDGFGMSKTLSLAKIGLPIDLEASDGEEFIKNYLNKK